MKKIYKSSLSLLALGALALTASAEAPYTYGIGDVAQDKNGVGLNIISANLVPNGDLTDGMADWTVSNNGTLMDGSESWAWHENGGPGDTPYVSVIANTGGSGSKGSINYSVNIEKPGTYFITVWTYKQGTWTRITRNDKAAGNDNAKIIPNDKFTNKLEEWEHNTAVTAISEDMPYITLSSAWLDNGAAVADFGIYELGGVADKAAAAAYVAAQKAAAIEYLDGLTAGTLWGQCEASSVEVAKAAVEAIPSTEETITDEVYFNIDSLIEECKMKVEYVAVALKFNPNGNYMVNNNGSFRCSNIYSDNIYWQIIPAGDNAYYLYNTADKVYAGFNSWNMVTTATAGTANLVQIIDTAEEGVYYLKMVNKAYVASDGIEDGCNVWSDKNEGKAATNGLFSIVYANDVVPVLIPAVTVNGMPVTGNEAIGGKGAAHVALTGAENNEVYYKWIPAPAEEEEEGDENDEPATVADGDEEPAAPEFVLYTEPLTFTVDGTLSVYGKNDAIVSETKEINITITESNAPYTYMEGDEVKDANGVGFKIAGANVVPNGDLAEGVEDWTVSNNGTPMSDVEDVWAWHENGGPGDTPYVELVGAGGGSGTTGSINYSVNVENPGNYFITVWSKKQGTWTRITRNNTAAGNDNDKIIPNDAFTNGGDAWEQNSAMTAISEEMPYVTLSSAWLSAGASIADFGIYPVSLTDMEGAAAYVAAQKAAAIEYLDGLQGGTNWGEVNIASVATAKAAVEAIPSTAAEMTEDIYLNIDKLISDAKLKVEYVAVAIKFNPNGNYMANVDGSFRCTTTLGDNCYWQIIPAGDDAYYFYNAADKVYVGFNSWNMVTTSTAGSANLIQVIDTDDEGVYYLKMVNKAYVASDGTEDGCNVWSDKDEAKASTNGLFSFIYVADIVEVPTMTANGEAVTENTVNFEETVEIAFTAAEGVDVYYKLGDAEYALYTAPFTVTESATLSFYGKKGENMSDTTTVSLVKKAEGVEEINAANGEAEYYNVNGVKVNGNLQPGIYVVRANGKTTKVIVK